MYVFVLKIDPIYNGLKIRETCHQSGSCVLHVKENPVETRIFPSRSNIFKSFQLMDIFIIVTLIKEKKNGWIVFAYKPCVP